MVGAAKMGPSPGGQARSLTRKRTFLSFGISITCRLSGKPQLFFPRLFSFQQRKRMAVLQRRSNSGAVGSGMPEVRIPGKEYPFQPASVQLASHKCHRCS